MDMTANAASADEKDGIFDFYAGHQNALARSPKGAKGKDLKINFERDLQAAFLPAGWFALKLCNLPRGVERGDLRRKASFVR